MFDSFKPGQNIRITVVKTPRASGRVSTIERLMRLDAGVIRGLRKAHKKRRQTTVVYNRGNRDWVKRQTCAKIVQALPGQSAVIPFNVSLVPDMKAVQQYLKIEAA
ncbi:MAG: hypothetical protein KIT68_06545 [Phycisphaeraceae bacterium]|nr:hypothetical protein [Phycisphaeraceae bacterium]